MRCVSKAVEVGSFCAPWRHDSDLFCHAEGNLEPLERLFTKSHAAFLYHHQNFLQNMQKKIKCISSYHEEMLNFFRC